MDKEILQTLIDKYKLSDEEHYIILQQLIYKIFSEREVEENPTVMFIVGQPGSGKTTFINSMDLSEYVIINSDEYRKLIKYSDEILEKYPTYYSKLTNYDAHLWGDELFSYGVSKGYSVLREKVPIDFSLIDLIKKLTTNHNIIINVVITGNLASLLATRERYEKEILVDKNAKLSNIDSHNKCYELLPEFITACIELGIKVNFVVPIGEDIKFIKPGEDYLTTLEELREQSNKKTCETFERRITKIKETMKNRNASKEEFDELAKIEKLYEEIKYNGNIK